MNFQWEIYRVTARSLYMGFWKCEVKVKYWQIFERCRRIYVCMYINNEMKITTLMRLIYIYTYIYIKRHSMILLSWCTGYFNFYLGPVPDLIFIQFNVRIIKLFLKYYEITQWNILYHSRSHKIINAISIYQETRVKRYYRNRANLYEFHPNGRETQHPFLRPIPNVTTIDSNCLLSDKFLAKRPLNRWRLYFASCIALRPPFRIGRKCEEAEAPVKKGQEVERVILRMTWNTSLYKRSEVEGTALPRSPRVAGWWP